ncbi:hypothetical protein H4S02_005326 [Coemansia sp. RSA 2611]|nr:hypothetical protein H4S01_004254 [Coemansia sp. RSA 2610]KAJ2383389.1 hypothetical protein H4S02_005326 [Coemansia sp. RSA 2611]
MKLHCIAILNRDGSPMYLRSFGEQQEEVQFYYVAHTACDVIEERIAQQPAGDLFVGQLQTVGDMVVHGYAMNTQQWIVVVSSVSTESAGMRNARVKEVCQSVHAAFVAMVCNPFDELGKGEQIKNARFERVIEQLEQAEF